MDREMKRHYTLLVDFLGKILGPDYEVALHELLDDSNEIIAIANGELTGRHLGSPLSNKMLEFLTSRLYETQDYVLRFESTSVTGKKLCSNSLFIKDPHGRLVGLLCINFDSSRYRELSARVMDLCGSLLTPGAPSGTHLIVENDEHTYPSSIAGATASIVSSVIADYPVPVDRLTQDEKMEIMDALNRKGVFLLKGARHVRRHHLRPELRHPDDPVYRAHSVRCPVQKAAAQCGCGQRRRSGRHPGRCSRVHRGTGCRTAPAVKEVSVWSTSYPVCWDTGCFFVRQYRWCSIIPTKNPLKNWMQILKGCSHKHAKL